MQKAVENSSEINSFFVMISPISYLKDILPIVIIFLLVCKKRKKSGFFGEFSPCSAQWPREIGLNGLPTAALAEGVERQLTVVWDCSRLVLDAQLVNANTATGVEPCGAGQEALIKNIFNW